MPARDHRQAAGGGVLTARERAVVDAIAQTIFPPGGAIPMDAREAGVVEWVDRFLASVPRQERVLIRLMFALFELAPLASPRPRPFTRMDPDRRRRWLAGWEQSRLMPRRTAFGALRSVILMAYAGHEGFEEALGIDDGDRILARRRAGGGADPSNPPDAREAAS